MNVLLIGSGGREHALAWKLAQSPMLDTLFAAPGNPGIARHATIAALDVTDHRAVIDFCRREHIKLVVIGPEAPLVEGLADNIRAIGVPVFGPGRAAAQLEGSKGFTKDLCARVGIPTARYFRVTSKNGALATLDDFGEKCVIKADGLAAGKGVTVAQTRAEAEAAIAALFADGPAEAVIEEMLEGPEASLFVLSDGTVTAAFGSAQDHKRVGEGDTGPNTGGMGAYSPAAVLTPELEERALGEIVRPTIDALAEAGTPYVGVLYAGLMLTADGPKLIEYNVRFGDPECQVLMMRFTGDLVELLLAVAEGRLADQPEPAFSPEVALTVVMAAKGYPGTPVTGGAIGGIDAAEATGAIVFQAGTKEADGRLVASGGRVLAVTASGPDVKSAQAAAYRAVDAIDFPDGFCRRDIGWSAI
ncbi:MULTISPECIES: phosphoribosylamine--glycine ligase [unclassified Sphingomonas]|uniref:phosphoribosylamine--glycine ligase n=1 Tax=unclassified Sphingomonas TaxID=196159 RepID=UPI0009268A26|nr:MULTISPECIES: phosphoribosylamine--glycine ligase [unclassified Sphingomonas]MBN8849112.1 phosphoribosylamine--glycine ligase [Sphingomonas sp.]OJV32809.1 MAG: phosphoribosylamine--glycine ligase [Sphingomonas sp. 67-36]